MSRKSWIHSFNITETRKYNNFTIYKITSIVFPKHLPEALTCVTLWKRFSDVKKLHKDLCKKQKDFHLSASLPKIVEHSYFKRFDGEVIEERKTYILQLLQFISEYPILYRSQEFQKFFEEGISPDSSPEKGNNIANICADLAIPIQPNIILIDPSRDLDKPEEELSKNGITDSFISMSSDIEIKNELDLNNAEGRHSLLEKGIEECTETSVLPEIEEYTETYVLPEIDEELDYILQAAMTFSEGAKAESNQEYKSAFDFYKKGIDQLLNGIKVDKNVERKKMAKEKTTKYLEKAEELYENHVLHQENIDIIQITTTTTNSHLERNLRDLYKYKVMRIVDRIMHVQDVTDKQFYAMKAIIKPTQKTMDLPHKILYMVPLISYFQTDDSIFLLLKLICGGKLWHYIRTYKNKLHENAANLEDELDQITSEESKEEVDVIIESNLQPLNGRSNSDYDSGFIELLSEYSKGDSKDKDEEENNLDNFKSFVNGDLEIDETDNFSNTYIPSFDTLSRDMNVIDLVNCSQLLLNSVSKTLENSKTEKKLDVQEIIRDTIIEEKVAVRPQERIVRIQESSQFESYVIDNFKRDDNSPSMNELLPEGLVRRWASELVLAIDCLHDNGIICGDLKMDNILLGSEGQIMLTYFYQKNEIPSEKAVINLYTAPMDKPLTYKSDWWSLGVILYEILTKCKFKAYHPLYVACYNEIQYPPHVEISEEADSLLQCLLQLEPSKRADFKQIVAHPFFASIDWSDVKHKGLLS